MPSVDGSQATRVVVLPQFCLMHLLRLPHLCLVKQNEVKVDIFEGYRHVDAQLRSLLISSNLLRALYAESKDRPMRW